jgi:hypothetical protein
VAIAAPLLALAILFGVYPRALFSYMTPTIDSQAQKLAMWTKDVKETGQAGVAVDAHKKTIPTAGRFAAVEDGR